MSDKATKSASRKTTGKRDGRGRFAGSATLAERFWKYVSRGGENKCWDWKGCLACGYGLMRVSGENGRWRMEGSHRVSYRLMRGAIPDGMCVLHHCDNPRCVNPNHLFLGTRGDNARDKAAKGRARGEWHPQHILTEKSVREIRNRRAAGEPLKELAKDYGIALCTVSAVFHGRLWSHIV